MKKDSLCEKIAKYFDNPILIADNRELVTYTGYIGKKRVFTELFLGFDIRIIQKEAMHLPHHL